MSSIIQILRSLVTGNRPTFRQAGEPYVNFADLQFGVNDGTNSHDLIGIRYFSNLANYVIGDHVVQSGKIFEAKSNIVAGNFNAGNWNQIATISDIGGPYLLLTGGALSGPTTIVTPALTDNSNTIPNTSWVNSWYLTQPRFSFRNRVANGNFSVDQRFNGNSTTITAGAALTYVADRFYVYCTGANISCIDNLSSTIFSAAGSPAYSGFSMSGAAGVTSIGIGHRIPYNFTYDLAGGTITISANLSNSLLPTISWALYYASAQDTFGTLAAPAKTLISSGAINVTPTMTRYSTTITNIPAGVSNGLELVLSVGAQTSGTFNVSNIQIEPGSVASPFEIRSASTEYNMCQTFFETSYATAVGSASQSGAVWDKAGPFVTAVYTRTRSIELKARKRAMPTIVLYSANSGVAGKIYDAVNSADVNGTTANVSTKAFQWTATNNATNTSWNFQFHYAADAELKT